MTSSATIAAPIEGSAARKRSFDARPLPRKKKQKIHRKPVKEGSHEEILLADVRQLLEKCSISRKEQGHSDSTTPELWTEIELQVSELSSTGDGLAVAPDLERVYVVPFTVPGETVTAKVVKHVDHHGYTLADLVTVSKPSPDRDDSLVRCPYFTRCSGCQFQMLPYEYQLAHKRTVVEKAYRNFSNLPPQLVPEVGETVGSPMQYGYRTKLTPHFDGPPGARYDKRHGVKPTFKEVPPIGFMIKGSRKTLDIEDCPIGTDAIRAGMKNERRRVVADIDTYRRGATLLLRESTKRIKKGDLDDRTNEPTSMESLSPEGIVLEERGDYIHEKGCVTDFNATTTEYVDDYIFTNPAGAFFQNNNSILPVFTSYIRSHILPPASSSPPSSPKITHLIDAYSGSGLFTITLSPLFARSIGIDISAASIASATRNAALNHIPESRASFLAADATRLFAAVSFPPAETAVVIDPPRKGCDADFLRQLVAFGPARVVYVSCNVHTQARDVGLLVGGMEGVEAGFGVGEGAYEMESLRGFDFFPQTGHVESVAVLRRKEGGGDSKEPEGLSQTDPT